MMGKSYMGVIRSHYVIDEQGKIIDAHIQVKPEDSVSFAIKAIGG
jgi:peroxiredoxin Q/BCP